MGTEGSPFSGRPGLRGAPRDVRHQGTGGTTYGMEKTTLYLPRELKDAVESAAAARGCSEAEVVREALRALTRAAVAPRPKLPLFRSGKRDLASNVEKALKGFGKR